MVFFGFCIEINCFPKVFLGFSMEINGFTKVFLLLNRNQWFSEGFPSLLLRSRSCLLKCDVQQRVGVIAVTRFRVYACAPD